jgi:hypothetical protein
MDIEPICHLLPVQHSSRAKAIIARAKVVGMHEICDAFWSKAIGPSAARADPPGKTALVEYVGDFRVNVVIEQFVEQFHDLFLRLYLLRRCPGVQRRERLGLAAFETDVDFCNSFRRNLNQSDVLDDIGQQPLAFSVRRTLTIPEAPENPSS